MHIHACMLWLTVACLSTKIGSRVSTILEYLGSTGYTSAVHVKTDLSLLKQDSTSQIIIRIPNYTYPLFHTHTHTHTHSHTLTHTLPLSFLSLSLSLTLPISLLRASVRTMHAHAHTSYSKVYSYMYIFIIDLLTLH